jgi:hypothetical protein
MAFVRLLAVAALASCLFATSAMAQTFTVDGLSFTVDGLSSGAQVIGLIAFSVKAAPALAMSLILAAIYRRSFVAKWLLVAVALSYLDSFLVTISSGPLLCRLHGVGWVGGSPNRSP